MFAGWPQVPAEQLRELPVGGGLGVARDSSHHDVVNHSGCRRSGSKETSETEATWRLVRVGLSGTEGEAEEDSSWAIAGLVLHAGSTARGSGAYSWTSWFDGRGELAHRFTRLLSTGGWTVASC
jgi:hypothetical protein